ncbi:MAG: roadblock/LC7 domain-containing protein [Gaiellaceae bacterium]
MDPASALADLIEISSQVDAAVVLDAEGSVLASTLEDAARSERLGRAGAALLTAGDESPATGARTLTQLEVALREGSVFAVREEGRSIVATTSAEPTSGLVFYDLKTCLRSLADGAAETAAKPKRRPKKEPADA